MIMWSNCVIPDRQSLKHMEKIHKDFSLASMFQTLKESLTECSSKYLVYIVKMTQYRPFRCEMTNFKIPSQVYICLHRKPLRVQHSEAQRLRFTCSFLCTSPQAKSIFEVKDTMTRMKSFNRFRLKCLHCAETLYINKTFYFNKEQKKTYMFSRKKKKRYLCNCHFVSWVSKMMKFIKQINFHLVPLLQ